MEGLACLQCGKALDQDFGIVACTNCGAVLMIDMDGQVQLAADNDKAAEAASDTPNGALSDAAIEAAAYEDALISPTEPASSFEAFADPQPEAFAENPVEDQDENPASHFGGSSDESSGETSDLGATDSTNDSSNDIVAEAPVEGSPAEPGSSENSSNDNSSDSSNENANWFDQGLDQPPPEAAQAVVPMPSGDFSDVSDFGNQDVDAGALQFDLTLSGIDHKEMRAEVMDVLADPRLFLNLRDLPIKNGTIVLPGLNAARTSLIVTRLQHLNLRINWKQRLYEA